jgi:glycosyltransferase involved in cell wall biosynthesis
VPTLQMLHRSAPINVVTTQVPYDEAWLALAFARWHRIPVIGQIHSDLFAESATSSRGRSLRHIVRDWLTRHTLSAFSAVRTVSSESRRSIAGMIGRRSLTTIPVPVHMVSTPTRGEAGTRKEPVIMFVGRLAPEKDLSLWLKVAHAVSQRVPEARFEVVGDGPERARLQREADLLGLGDAVSFPGFLSHDHLRERYARASAVLLTSRAEGFGRVLVEAASQGTTAVATSLAGPRDIVINGVTGFLHEPGDVDGFARSVSTLVRMPQRAADMGARARLLVNARFDPDRLRAAWVDLWVTTARAGWAL